MRAAFGQEGGPVPDRFLVFLGALSLLAEAAAERPVLAVVDDAQWLDEASAAALSFVARRLDYEPVALVFAAREGDVRRFEGEDLPVVLLGGLDLVATRELLGQTITGDVGAEVSAQLLASTGGNPLALLELPRVLTADQLAGRAALPGRLPVTETLRRVFLDRADRLSRPARSLLLVAAAEDVGRIAAITAAATTLGAGSGSLEEVERSGLVRVLDGLLRFRHPLVASAVYAAATAAERSAAHAALADVLTGAEDRDRRVWHRAAATTTPDLEVAAELVEVARRAGRRGGHEAAAAAWERAAELSVDPGRQAEYRYAAAGSAWLAGRVDRARAAADIARAAEDPLLAADAARLRARIEWNSGSTALAQRMLLEAATAVVGRDPSRARLLAMFAAAVSSVGGRSGTDIDPCAFAAARPDDEPGRGRCLSYLIIGFNRVADGDIAAGAPALRSAIEAGAAAGIDDYDITPNLAVAAMHLGDLRTMAAVHERMLSHARHDGVLVVVLYTLTRLAFSDLAYGAWSTAVARQTEALELGTATGQPILAGAPQAALLLISALRGEDGFAERLAELQPVLDGPPAGVLDLLMRDLVRWAQAMRSFPRSEEGLHHLAQMNLDVLRRQAGLDRIEAAAHAGQRELAQLWIGDLDRFAAVTGEAWAAAIVAHGRALLAEQPDADRNFEQALRLHGRAGRPFDHARTELAYGEHLRRTRRRVAARQHLRAALHGFEDLRAAPWVERAGMELRASGESVRHRDLGAPVELTPQELQVAQLVQQGHTNRDVAGQLFVSPRTVDFHLQRVRQDGRELAHRARPADARLNPPPGRTWRFSRRRHPVRVRSFTDMTVSHPRPTLETTPTPAGGEPLDVLVIGAGQAGLALAWHLSRARSRYLVVDAAPEIGHSWRTRWDSLRLFTPRRYDGLPGSPFPGPGATYPGKDEVADYLRTYAQTHALPVLTATPVRRLRPAAAGFEAVTGQGVLRARQVVIATGPFQRPHVPALAGRFDPGLPQVHSADYRNPAQLSGETVLVVGGGNSGLQIADELRRSRRVVLAIGSRVPVLPQRLLGQDLFWWLTRFGLIRASATSPLARRVRARGDLVIGDGPRRLRRRGVDIRPRLSGADGRTAQFADGGTAAIDAVVWATGYRCDYSWIDAPVTGADGQPIHHGGRSPVPGLWYLGLPWQRSRGSALLGFVQRDAAHLAADIAAHAARDRDRTAR